MNRGWLSPPAVLLWLAIAPGFITAQTTVPPPVFPEHLHWTSPLGHPAIQSAWVLGAESQPGLYLLRVTLAADGRIPPHTHPDERATTVLSGTLYIGFGEAFDESRVIALPLGTVYVAPAQTSHYVWAKEGETVYQEAGIGPTGTAFVRH